MERMMEFLLHGLIGAALLGLIAWGVGWWMGSPNWWIIAGVCLAGFVVCGTFKDQAFGWLLRGLGELLWWT